LREKVLLEAVVVLALQNDEVLLAQKVEGKDEIKIGEGVWNGFGGGVEREKGETPRQAAIREPLEETRKDDQSENGLIIKSEDLELRAVVFCHNLKKDGRKFKCKLYVYVTEHFEGIIEDSPEMVNATFFPTTKLSEIPMIPTDLDWLPYVFAGELIIARVFLKDSQRTKTAPTQIRKVARLSCD
jgi:8-oxo-dGTP pyrophosphatase MutT (NUDIX family)